MSRYREKYHDRRKNLHFRQTIYTVMGIFFIIALFGAAMVFPGYYSRFYDQNTLNHTSFSDVNVTTYETSYNSFVEKLHAIARAWQEDTGMRAVRTNELEETANRTELTRIVKKELDKLYKLAVLEKEMNPKEKRLVQWERYTIYETKESGGMKGISLWKLVYETSKRTVTIYLDEEYHKIYYMEILYKETKTVFDVSAVQTKDGYSGGGGTIENCWPLIMVYYDISSYQEGTVNSWINDGQTAAVVEFDEKYQISFLCEGINSIEFQDFRLGLPLDKMIQF